MNESERDETARPNEFLDCRVEGLGFKTWEPRHLSTLSSFSCLCTFGEFECRSRSSLLDTRTAERTRERETMLYFVTLPHFETLLHFTEKEAVLQSVVLVHRPVRMQVQIQPVPVRDVIKRILSHRMYLLISFRKPTLPQNCQLFVYYHLSKY